MPTVRYADRRITTGDRCPDDRCTGRLQPAPADAGFRCPECTTTWRGR